MRTEAIPVARTLLVAAATLWLGSAPFAAQAQQPGVFGSIEVRREGLHAFPKWTDALDKYFREERNARSGCEDPRFGRCHYRAWRSMLASLQGRAPLDQIEAVHQFMNRTRYITDPLNWGVRDYWESPGEFFERFGDCEDYAIAKFLSLRALGLSANQLRIIIVKDMNLDAIHAVLTVTLDDTTYVLDNQLAITIEADRIHHYVPIYSVNETGWWRHQPATP